MMKTVKRTRSSKLALPIQVLPMSPTHRKEVQQQPANEGNADHDVEERRHGRGRQTEPKTKTKENTKG
ncbi:hypothetical protein PM082_020275 [Marasmius tenuissimus]|nr:hypothetical protein PM082_020275 [Marasmius tenuissimus]